MAARQVLHRVPGLENVRVRAELEYASGDAGALVFDLYPPLHAPDVPPPVVVIAAGYPDPGFKTVFGCRFKDAGFVTSWARLLAASGVAAITYANEQPERDLRRLLAHVRANGAALGLDASRIGLWASSGNAPVALAELLHDAPTRIVCAALLYPLTLDLDGGTGVAKAARRFGFANACAGRSVADLARDLPLLLVRAGRDEFEGLNEALDRFFARALAANLPVALANHPEGVHAFELSDASPRSVLLVEQVLAFLRGHLYAAVTTVNRG
jgi:hypothetical protein